MMANHPNRNWRAKMRASFAAWRTTEEGSIVVDMPLRPGGSIEERARLAYEAGYRDGRRRDDSR